MPPAHTTPIEISHEAERIFRLQSANKQKIAATTASERKRKLRLLAKLVLKYRDEIKEALYKDFRKHGNEVDMTEIFPVLTAARYAAKNLSRWIQSQSADTPFPLFGTSSWIHHEPKGVALIMSPWNFPLNLTFSPLVSAIAAGNCVVLKPSEHTPNISALMKKMVSEIFEESEVALIEGDAEVATVLLKLPFNHIFFTGSPEVGKIVMVAAAKNLASVTLELGGKSPAIVDETANLQAAAERIALAKWVNAGQMCVSPDYVFVHKKVMDGFVENLKAETRKIYGDNISESDAYARIVNRKHYNRLKNWLGEALSKSGELLFGGQSNDEQLFIEPTAVTKVPEDTALMQQEIFGPVLPLVAFENAAEVIEKINAGEKPLCLYIYSRNKKNIDRLIADTRAGGTCINQSAVHFYNYNLPFGGINHSGIGKAHGIYGFKAFSNERGMLRQWSPFNTARLVAPPYAAFQRKVINLLLKWFSAF